MRTMRLKVSELHWWLIGTVVLLCLAGIYNLHSSASAHDPDLYLSQGGIVLGGMVMVGLMLMVDYRMTEAWAYVAYGIVAVLLVAVLVQGRVAGGAQRWLVLGPIGFQPSELAKLGTVFCLARYFAHRNHPGRYTLRALIRPLNISRPLAIVAALILFWSQPWLRDPIGELARAIYHGAQGLAPTIADLMWFRVALFFAIFLFSVVVVFGVLRAQRQSVLLNPWPKGRRRRIFAGLAFLVTLIVAAVIWQWNAPWLRDPFGTWFLSLYKSAGPGGVHAELNDVGWLRAFLVIATAAYLALSILRTRGGGDDSVDLLIAPIDILVVPALLIFVEPDLGTAGTVVLVGVTMILVVGVRPLSLLVMGGLSLLGVVVAWFGLLKPYQKQRVLTFWNPESDIQGDGWNSVQSMIAVGSGKFLGKGHHEGTQTQFSFLPEQHTDFAFSVWAEEMGFLGCVSLIMLYFLLLALAFAIAADARDRYGALLAVGVAGIFAWHTMINIAMVIGVFPVVGLTLPLFSYGGTSAMTMMFGIGILLNVHWRRHTQAP